MNSVLRTSRNNNCFPSVVTWLLLCCFGIHAQVILLVCIPGKQNTQKIQKNFDELLGPGKTMAFGRIKDLDARLNASSDVAVIASEPFFTYTPGFTVFLSGTSDTSTGERYHIVAASGKITESNVVNRKVGIVDFLGKERLPHFVEDQFGLELQTMKRVNKEEDLLTMIGMEMVDAVIVSATRFREMQSNTKLPLRIIASSKNRIGFAAYGRITGNEKKTIRNVLLGAPETILREIGIDGWESP